MNDLTRRDVLRGVAALAALAAVPIALIPGSASAAAPGGRAASRLAEAAMYRYNMEVRGLLNNSFTTEIVGDNLCGYAKP